MVQTLLKYVNVKFDSDDGKIDEVSDYLIVNKVPIDNLAIIKVFNIPIIKFLK